MQSRAVLYSILALGVTQIIGYGGLYYAFTVTAPAITREFGWSSAWTYAAFSIGMLFGGLVAPYAGRAIDRYSAPPVMTIGSVLAALSLVGLANARDLPTYFIAMIAVEIVSTLVLYDAAFTLLTQVAGRDARAAITKLTLIAGFASTIFWPLTAYLEHSIGWRGTYLVYAALLLVVCVPVHFSLRIAHQTARRIASRASGTANATALDAPGTYHPANGRAFWLVVVFFATGGFVVSVLSVHMLQILTHLGYAASLATLIGMIQGPSQVGARLVEFTFAKSLSPRTTAIVSAGLMPLGLSALAFTALGPIAGVLFALSYGAGLGLNSIVRGTLPLMLFGARGYGATMGRLSAPGLVVRSTSPLVFALVQEAAGLTTALLLLGAVAVISLLAVLMVPGGPPQEPGAP